MGKRISCQKKKTQPKRKNTGEVSGNKTILFYTWLFPLIFLPVIQGREKCVAMSLSSVLDAFILFQISLKHSKQQTYACNRQVVSETCSLLLHCYMAHSSHVE